jgi:hypothetical protein
MHVKLFENYKIRQSVLFVLLLCLLISVTGCGGDEEEIKQEISYELCSQTMIPDELAEIIAEKINDSFTMSYSTNDYTYIVVGYGMHQRDGYVVELKDIFATDYACYVQCAILTEEYVKSMEGVRICSPASSAPYLVLRCRRLSKPVMFACE